jgi:hypothetical protein
MFSYIEQKIFNDIVISRKAYPCKLFALMEVPTAFLKKKKKMLHLA